MPTEMLDTCIGPCRTREIGGMNLFAANLHHPMPLQLKARTGMGAYTCDNLHKAAGPSAP